MQRPPTSQEPESEGQATTAGAFSRLPQEIRESVFRRVPGSLPQLSRASSAVYGMTQRPYLEELCSRPITNAEIAAYLRSEPTLLGISGGLDENDDTQFESPIYSLIDSDRPSYAIARTLYNIRPVRAGDPTHEDLAADYGTLYDVNFYSAYNDNLDIGNIIIWHNFIPRHLATRVHAEGAENEEDDDAVDRDLHQQGPVELDLLSQYRILQQRAGCRTRARNTRGPHYDFAKDVILRKLDAVYEQYRQDPNIDAVFKTWPYMYLQARVLNLHPVPKMRDYRDWVFTFDGHAVFGLYGDADEETLRDMTEEINTLRREIDQMFTAVRAALEFLRPNVGNAA